jgi:hypothetical protein
MALPQPEQATLSERFAQPGFPIVRALGLVNGMVCILCLTAAASVRPWRLARQAAIAAPERVALMTRCKGGRRTEARP